MRLSAKASELRATSRTTSRHKHFEGPGEEPMRRSSRRETATLTSRTKVFVATRVPGIGIDLRWFRAGLGLSLGLLVQGLLFVCFFSRFFCSCSFSPSVLKRPRALGPPPPCKRNAVVAGASSPHAGHSRAGKRGNVRRVKEPREQVAGIGVEPIKVAEARRRQTSQAFGKGGGGSCRKQTRPSVHIGAAQSRSQHGRRRTRQTNSKSAASVLQRPPASTPRTTRRQRALPTSSGVLCDAGHNGPPAGSPQGTGHTTGCEWRHNGRVDRKLRSNPQAQAACSDLDAAVIETSDRHIQIAHNSVARDTGSSFFANTSGGPLERAFKTPQSTSPSAGCSFRHRANGGANAETGVDAGLDEDVVL